METLNKSGISPIGDKIVIEPIKIEKKTKGGIVLPDETHQKEELAVTIGRIVAAGSQAVDDLAVDGIMIGQAVLFLRYSGHRFPVEGTNYWILRASSVLGKAEKMPDYTLSGAESPMEVFGDNRQVA